MKKSLLMGCVAAVAAFVAQAASAAELRMLSSWDQNYPQRQMLVEPFIKDVEAATNGGIKIRISGPETVPSFEQLQPVGAGVFHLLFTHGAYHFGTSPIATAVEALSGTLDQWRAGGIKQHLDEHYARFGVKLLMLAPSAPGQGYHMVLRSPVKPSGDLQGYKIRATPTYDGVLKLLNASPVILPPAEVYTSLEKGLVDGAAWPTFGVFNNKWHEVSKFVLRPAFGTTTQLIFVNLATWNKLSDAEKKVLMSAAEKAEETYYNGYTKLVEEELDKLLKAGMQVAEMGPDQKARLTDAWAAGQWENSAKKMPAETDALRKLAVAKGLAK
jgi:TRAP-type C4-dicarboxylate transport system substrate-binding protein